jgi:hypothetical protein
VSKSAMAIVAFAAITVSSLAQIQSAEARRYSSYCGHPEYGYLAPYPLGGNNTPRVVLFPLWLLTPLTLMSSGDAAALIVAGKSHKHA